MRRGAGVGAIKNKSLAQAKFKDKGTELADSQLCQLTKQMDTFKSNLEEFAAKHKDKIRRQPAFRAQFQQMCATIGVDPLASSKGFWSEMLGVGDFYYHLGVRIIEVCMATSHRTGGLIDLDQLCTALNRTRSSQETEISQDDVSRAIKKLNVLGNGFTLVTLGNRVLVQSVPGELSLDQTNVLALAEATSHVTVEDCVAKLNWSEERSMKALSILVKEGMAWVDDGDRSGKRQYWVPSLFQVLWKSQS